MDIGSGDGRVLIAAMQQYPQLQRAIGVEIDSALVALSQRRVAAQGLSQCVHIVHQDWMQLDMRHVDVVILFFLPHPDLAQLLQSKLKVGTRVVTYVFRIPQWAPIQQTTTAPFMTTKGSSPIFVYRVPPTA